MKLKKSERRALLAHLGKAQDVCAKYGLALGNGGDIASMLSGIRSEIENNEAKENEFLAEENRG